MARAGYRFAFRRRVRYAEVDAQAVVYFARYLEWADVGVVEYWRAAGVFQRTPIAGGEAEFHVVRAEVDYHAPMRLDEEIDICVTLERIRRTSATFRCELHGLANGEAADDLRATIRQVQVHVDQAGGRPTPVPGWFIDLFERYEGRPLKESA
ncbi:MAG: acyl-CoA thioesterase [Sphingomonadaceae bacterium]|uniref:acyl-CoA thioesterase n=1 Tax=Thermaurantiacus sp. TaxID=2820283 RepID=UPI00298F10B4|nr:thioesterase family protein [Thermaurantiacus sp.]MCS6987408.1 acyl-CoA thioesterase [Sphingomonadaceae bacterium]MDW8415328.1 thioesterase family protein [Thermaurantiacus sp.]